jgi:hypothetical protein
VGDGCASAHLAVALAGVHQKRRRPKARRAGCLLCKPQKLNTHKTVDRMQARPGWQRDWGLR